TINVPALAVAAPEGKAQAGGEDGVGRGFWGGQRIGGVAVGAAGVVGLAGGAGLGGAEVGTHRAGQGACAPGGPGRSGRAGVAWGGEWWSGWVALRAGRHRGLL